MCDLADLMRSDPFAYYLLLKKGSRGRAPRAGLEKSAAYPEEEIKQPAMAEQGSAIRSSHTTPHTEGVAAAPSQRLQ